MVLGCMRKAKGTCLCFPPGDTRNRLSKPEQSISSPQISPSCRSPLLKAQTQREIHQRSDHMQASRVSLCPPVHLLWCCSATITMLKNYNSSCDKLICKRDAEYLHSRDFIPEREVCTQTYQTTGSFLQPGLY